MPAIQELTWQEISTLTWGYVSQYQWIDFRIALMDVEVEQSVTGVIVQQSYTVATTYAESITRGVAIVQSPVIMGTRTEMITSIIVSDRAYKSEMLKNLPLYERKSGVFDEILTANDREFRNAEQELSVVERNMFVDTAIESIPLFERDLGIQSVKSLRYDQRREQISSRYRASFDQTTKQTIKSVAAAYSNGDVDVNPTTTDGVYEIRFIGSRGVPNNIDGLKKALDIIIPAHLGLTYIFTFTPWGELTNMTWGQAADKTWEELRLWNEVI